MMPSNPPRIRSGVEKEVMSEMGDCPPSPSIGDVEMERGCPARDGISQPALYLGVVM